MMGIVARTGVALLSVSYVTAEEITPARRITLPSDATAENKQEVGAGSKGSFLARMDSTTKSTAGDNSSFNAFHTFLNAQREKMMASDRAGTADLIPPIYDITKTNKQEQLVLAETRGRNFNTKAKEQFNQGENGVCAQMADWKNWFWTLEEWMESRGVTESRSNAASAEDDAKAMWAGQSPINEKWRSEACSGVHMNDINKYCRDVGDARNSFVKVCGGRGTSSCASCR